MSRGSINSNNNSLVSTTGPVPQSYIKQLESRALLDHYDQNQHYKMTEDIIKKKQKERQLNEAKMQNQMHLREIERKRRMKELIKYQYSGLYDEMIKHKETKVVAQKQHDLELQKKILNNGNWVRDMPTQMEEIRVKKMEYGKQLEQHLRLQEEKRMYEAVRLKQLKEKWKKQSEEIAKKQKIDIEMSYRRRSMFERRQNDILGVKSSLIWDEEPIIEEKSNEPLTPRMDRMLKVKQQKLYGEGLQKQYQFESEKRILDRALNPEKYAFNKTNQTISPATDVYNPITNPIQFKYKNPNVLRMLAHYGM